MAASQADVRKVDNEMAKKAEKPPSNLQDVKDQKMREKEDAAPTTRTNMGKMFAKGGSIRGGGCETRGKTKGRMV